MGVVRADVCIEIDDALSGAVSDSRSRPCARPLKVVHCAVRRSQGHRAIRKGARWGVDEH